MPLYPGHEAFVGIGFRDRVTDVRRRDRNHKREGGTIRPADPHAAGTGLASHRKFHNSGSPRTALIWGSLGLPSTVRAGEDVYHDSAIAR